MRYVRLSSLRRFLSTLESKKADKASQGRFELEVSLGNKPFLAGDGASYHARNASMISGSSVLGLPNLSSLKERGDTTFPGRSPR